MNCIGLLCVLAAALGLRENLGILMLSKVHNKFLTYSVSVFEFWSVFLEEKIAHRGHGRCFLT